MLGKGLKSGGSQIPDLKKSTRIFPKEWLLSLDVFGTVHDYWLIL